MPINQPKIQMLSARRDIPLHSVGESSCPAFSLSPSRLLFLSLSFCICVCLRGDKQAATAQLVATFTLVCTLYNSADDDVQLYPSYCRATVGVTIIAVQLKLKNMHLCAFQIRLSILKKWSELSVYIISISSLISF